MVEYIEREAVLKIIADNCPHDKGGYNTEEEMGAGSACYYIRKDVETLPTADVVPKSEVAFEVIAQIEQAKEEITDRLEEFIAEWKEYSESTVDYFGGKYDAMETASRIVKSILTDKTAELKKKYTEENT